jgi:hypothetical protein
VNVLIGNDKDRSEVAYGRTPSGDQVFAYKVAEIGGGEADIWDSWTHTEAEFRCYTHPLPSRPCVFSPVCPDIPRTVCLKYPQFNRTMNPTSLISIRRTLERDMRGFGVSDPDKEVRESSFACLDGITAKGDEEFSLSLCRLLVPLSAFSFPSVYLVGSIAHPRVPRMHPFASSALRIIVF